MSSTYPATVIAVFEDRYRAEQAVDDLRRAGFTDEQIGVALRHGDSPEGTTDLTSEGSEAPEGAATGAITGGVAGGLLGAAAVGLIPGIGPILAIGALAGVLGGAAAGAAAGGLLGGLVGMGVPEEDARYYDEEFRAGRTIVTVQAGGRADEARSILSENGGHARMGAGADYGTDHGYATDRQVGRDTTLGAGRVGDATGSATSMGVGQSTSETFRPAGGSNSQTWDDEHPTFRSDWERGTTASGRNWSDVESAHRFSHERYDDPRYQGRSFDEAENDLRSDYADWSRQRGGQYDDSTWGRSRDDFRDAWDRVGRSGRGRRTDTDEGERRGGDDLPPIL